MFKKYNFFSGYKKYLVLGLVAIAFGTGSYVWYTHHHVTHAHQSAREEIKGTLVTLKPLKEAHFIDYHNMFSPIVRKSLEFPEAITLNYTVQYLHEEKKKADDGTIFGYCIFDNTDNKLIGHLEIRVLDPKDLGQFGCWINEEYWGGGRFQEALDLISKAYFRLHPHEKEYIAYVRLWNKRSYHALKKYGFQEAGYYYDAHNKPGGHILKLMRP